MGLEERTIMIKWLRKTFCYGHRAVPCSAVIEKASSCRRKSKHRDSQLDSGQSETETFVPKRDAHQIPPFRAWEPCGEETGRLLKQRGRRTSRKHCLPDKTGTHMNPQNLWQCAQGLHWLKTDGPVLRVEMGIWLPNHNCFRRKH